MLTGTGVESDFRFVVHLELKPAPAQAEPSAVRWPNVSDMRLCRCASAKNKTGALPECLSGLPVPSSVVLKYNSWVNPQPAQGSIVG